MRPPGQQIELRLERQALYVLGTVARRRHVAISSLL